MTDESTDLIAVEKINPAILFASESEVDEMVSRIRAKVVHVVHDVTTDAGRKACASLARKVVRSKTLLDEQGKAMVAERKSELKLVDAERKRLRDSLDALRDTVRQPLTEWEAEDEAKKQAVIAESARKLREQQEQEEREREERDAEFARKEAELAAREREIADREAAAREAAERAEFEAQALKRAAERAESEAIAVARREADQAIARVVAESEKAAAFAAQVAVNDERQRAIDAERDAGTMSRPAPVVSARLPDIAPITATRNPPQSASLRRYSRYIARAAAGLSDAGVKHAASIARSIADGQVAGVMIDYTDDEPPF